MRRALVVPPLALLTSACFSRPWTPAVSVAYWSEPVPPARAFDVPRATDVLQRWQLPAGNAWAPYQKMTLVTSLDMHASHGAPLPDVRELEVVARAELGAARLAAQGLPSETLWMVDLRGAASVAFGAALSTRAGPVKVSNVLTFNNWPADDAMIPAEETLAALVAMRPVLPQADEQPTAPVFLLDAWRLAYRDDAVDDETTDNRYMLMPADFPDAAALRRQGISRVVYLVEDLDDTEVEEDDLHATFAAWSAAGISIFMIDLAWVEHGAPYVERWGPGLRGHALVVGPRRTLVDDPIFYARARGGFGGVHSRGWGRHPGLWRGGGGGGGAGGG